jgi:CrcB protein
MEESRLKDWTDFLIHLATSRVMLLCVGGAAGTNARYCLGLWITGRGWTRGFPVGTLLINVLGSFLLAFTLLVLDRITWARPTGILLIGTGFCGGFTTFSTFSYEAWILVENGHWLAALLYVLASVVAGFLAVVLAVFLMSTPFPPK